MGNEAFLISSYVLGGVTCVCLGWVAYLWLRRPVEQVIDALHRTLWADILRKSFPVSLMLFALSGFLSVSYYGCPARAYKAIVPDRDYIIGVNQRQVSQTLSSITIAVFLWAVIITISLLIIRHEQMKRNSS